MNAKGNSEDISRNIRTYMDFLQLDDGSFVRWRLLRTEEDDRYWGNFIAEHPELREAFVRAVAVMDSLRLNEHRFQDTDLLYERIRASIRTRQARRANRVQLLRRLAAAAAIVLLALLPTLLYNNLRDSNVYDTDKFTAQVLKGENVELVIDHRRIVLQDSANVWIKDGKICYDDRSSGTGYTSVTGKQCRMIVPLGKHSFLSLADLSKVWVNSGSVVEFASAFDKSTRDLKVDGEIYIDVAKNSRQPFVVHTSKLDVVVHGTSFDVSAYRDEHEVSVVLVRGKVQVDAHRRGSVWMEPSERLALAAGKLSKERVDVSYYTSWKDGYFTFNETPVEEVLRKVGKYYNIRFSRHYACLAGKKITGKLYLSANPDDALSAIALITSTTYKRDNDTITFTHQRKETTPMENNH